MRYCGKRVWSRAATDDEDGACALHAAYLGLHIHT